MPASDKIGTVLDAATEARYGIKGGGAIKPGDETPGPDYYIPPFSEKIPRGITANPPTTFKREDGAIVTTGGTVLFVPTGRENPPVIPAGTKEPTTEGIVYGDPQRMIDYLARWKNYVPKLAEATPQSVPSLANIMSLKTNEMPIKQPVQPSNPYNGYINYDPDEILAAAMRVMNGRMAGRSILSDLRR